MKLGQPTVGKHPLGRGWGCPEGLSGAGEMPRALLTLLSHILGCPFCPSTLPSSLLKASSHHGSSGRALGTSLGSSGADSLCDSSNRSVAGDPQCHQPQEEPTNQLWAWCRCPQVGTASPGGFWSFLGIGSCPSNIAGCGRKWSSHAASWPSAGSGRGVGALGGCISSF